MPFRLSAAAAGVAGGVTGRGLGRVLQNPLATALIVTALALIITTAALRDYGPFDAEDKLRGASYVFLATSLVLALHYFALDRKLRDDLRVERSSDFYDRVNARGGVQPAHYVPIEPQSVFSAGSRAPTEYGGGSGAEHAGGDGAEHAGGSRAPMPFNLKQPSLEF